MARKFLKFREEYFGNTVWVNPKYVISVAMSRNLEEGAAVITLVNDCRVVKETVEEVIQAINNANS